MESHAKDFSQVEKNVKPMEKVGTKYEWPKEIAE